MIETIFSSWLRGRFCSAHPIHSQSEVFDNSKIQILGLRAATMSATMENLIRKYLFEIHLDKDIAAFPSVPLKRASGIAAAASLAGMVKRRGDFQSVAQLDKRRLES